MLGTHLARFSSAQGLSLLITNILHYSSIAVVARCSGPSKLGSYALLFFLTGLVTQVIHLLSKPGTMMRTFGVSDDDDDSVEEDDDKDAPEEASTRPSYTLGVGTLWTIMLAVTVSLLVFVFRTPIAQFLLHDPAQADAVVFATITGCVWAIFKLGEMVIWFEGRALTYALIEAARPAFNLIAIVAILSAGAGVKGAIIGQTIGTTTATVICIALIWSSFELGLLVRRAEGDPEARRDPGADRIVDVGGPERRLVHPLPVPGPQGRSASTTSPRGPGSWSPSCPRASGSSLRPIRKTAVLRGVPARSTGWRWPTASCSRISG